MVLYGSMMSSSYSRENSIEANDICLRSEYINQVSGRLRDHGTYKRILADDDKKKEREVGWSLTSKGTSEAVAPTSYLGPAAPISQFFVRSRPLDTPVLP